MGRMLTGVTSRRLIVALILAPLVLGAFAFRYYVNSLHIDPPPSGGQEDAARRELT